MISMVITAKSLRTFIFLLIGLLLVALAGYGYLLHGTPASPETLMVQRVKLDQGRLQLGGTTSSSAAGYSGYSYTIKDGKLYVNVRYSLLSSSGDFSIDMPVSSADSIRNVYLQGSSSDDVLLLWSE